MWYNTLRWNLDENVSETQSLHSNVIRTAFALEHNAERFYIKVNISGKLSSRSDRFKNKFKFGSDQGIVTTMIEWRDGYHCPKVLDKIAESLPFDMQRENLANVSMEMPDALSASFGPATTLTPATNNPTELSFQVIQELDPSSPVGLLDGAQPPSPLRITEPEPTIENMVIAAGLLEAPPVETGRRVSYPRSESRFSEAVTLVENGEGRNGRTVSFTPNLEQVEIKVEDKVEDVVEDEDAGSEVAPLPTSNKGFPMGHLFGLLAVFSWFGDIGLLCAAAIFGRLGFPLPEKYGLAVKGGEKEARTRRHVEGPKEMPKKRKRQGDEDNSAGETIASVSPSIPRGGFIRGRARDRVSFTQSVK